MNSMGKNLARMALMMTIITITLISCGQEQQIDQTELGKVFIKTIMPNVDDETVTQIVSDVERINNEVSFEVGAKTVGDYRLTTSLCADAVFSTKLATVSNTTESSRLSCSAGEGGWGRNRCREDCPEDQVCLTRFNDFAGWTLYTSCKCAWSVPE